ncbi:MurR/RpiR family transcriptional regulator [Alkalibacillus sp. S2W]|uniref:MurR/RpiR family transcriptional regulator n=1 Tax=Alkalibacillus sp. S2W TaxID=3386553 RepID=UPI00398CAC9F
MIERLNTQSLSKKLQYVVDYYQRLPQAFAMHSAEKLGELIDVSESTIIRFAQELGFKGFKDFQQAVQEKIFENEKSLSSFTYGKPTAEQSHNLVHDTMWCDQEHINMIRNQLPASLVEAFVTQLEFANQIYVAGTRTSASLAHWFTFGLNLVTGKAQLYDQQHSDFISIVTDMKPNTILVVFSFHRYAKSTLHLAQEAKKQGMHVLAVTDSEVAPISQHADVLIPIQLPVRSTLDAAPVTFSFLNGVLTDLSLKQGETFQERTQKFESVQLDDFFYK